MHPLRRALAAAGRQRHRRVSTVPERRVEAGCSVGSKSPASRLPARLAAAAQFDLRPCADHSSPLILGKMLTVEVQDRGSIHAHVLTHPRRKPSSIACRACKWVRRFGFAHRQDSGRSPDVRARTALATFGTRSGGAWGRAPEQTRRAVVVAAAGSSRATWARAQAHAARCFPGSDRNLSLLYEAATLDTRKGGGEPRRTR